MARLFEIFFDIDRIVAEGRAGFRARRCQCDTEIFFVARDLHAASAAAGRRLDDDRVADFGGDAPGCVLVGDRPLGAGHHRNAETFGRAFGFDLVAHHPDMVSGRADESDVVGSQDVGEFGVFRQEAIAGMDRVRAGDLAGRHDLVDVEIAVARRRRPHAHALVGEFDVHGVGVGGRVDRYRLDAEFLGRPQHAQGDFPAIGNEDFMKHHRLTRPRPKVRRTRPAANPRTGSP